MLLLVVAGVLVYPPANTPRVGEDAAVTLAFDLVKSPKSVLFPIEAIVTYSIVFEPVTGDVP
jgi:hypothetical protein